MDNGYLLSTFDDYSSVKVIGSSSIEVIYLSILGLPPSIDVATDGLILNMIQH